MKVRRTITETDIDGVHFEARKQKGSVAGTSYECASPVKLLQIIADDLAIDPLAEWKISRKFPKCEAVLHHGPGHQSASHCCLRGDGHEVHQETHGRRWRGMEAFTDFFGELPVLD